MSSIAMDVIEVKNYICNFDIIDKHSQIQNK
jgi:hypothetical protein